MRYTRGMRRTTKLFSITACLSLLWLQSSGLHVHMDDSGSIGVPGTSLTHSNDRHDHHDAHHADPHASTHGDHHESGRHDHHEDARDVSLVDLANGAFKMPLAILALVLLFAVSPLVRSLAGAEIIHPILSGRHTRWRPPLRAPPATA